MLDSVPLLPSATPFRAARGRRERQPTSTGPPTNTARGSAEADATAVQYMTVAGINPTGMVTMFEKLLAERQRNPGAVERWFSTHPTTQERIDNVQAAISSLPQGSLRGLTWILPLVALGAAWGRRKRLLASVGAVAALLAWAWLAFQGTRLTEARIALSAAAVAALVPVTLGLRGV